MLKLKLKMNHEPNQFLKNLGVLLFNIFAGFFNWFIVLVCLIILVSGYWWLIKPKYDFIASDQELAFRAKEYEDKVNYLKKLNEVKDLYSSIGQNDKDKIDTILSSGQDIDRLKIILLREVGQVGKETGATLDNIIITPLDTSVGKFITIAGTAPNSNQLFSKMKIVQISFSARTVDYEAVKKILLKLEKSLRIMDVVKLSIDPFDRNASFDIITYFLEK